MIEPKEVEVDGKTFHISKVPAMAGREIFTQYITTGAPKIGDYDKNQALMLKMMSFVSVETEGGMLSLSTKELINNHVPSWENLMLLEKHMIEYNCSFFANGKLSSFLEKSGETALDKITSMLTGLLQQSLQADK